MVLKKMGAITPPITKPPVRLFGAQGMSWPAVASVLGLKLGDFGCFFVFKA